MAHTRRRQQGHFTRISDDCPICRLMERLDREGLLEEVEVEGLGEAESVFKGPRYEPFDRMTLEEAKALLKRLPAPPGPVLLDEPPSFARMVALGERYPGMLFYGFRVDPNGRADHVILEGFYVPAEHAKQVSDELARKPDACEALVIGGKPYWREWWV